MNRTAPDPRAVTGWKARGRAARSGARPLIDPATSSARYAPNFWGNCFTIASASGSAIIRMWPVAERSIA